MFEANIREYLDCNGFEVFCPKAVLFDMDGVLYDSMPNHAVSWHSSMIKFGLHIQPEEVYTYEGMRGVETIKLLAKREWNKVISDQEAEKIYRAKSFAFNQLPPARKMPGVEKLMNKIKYSSLRIGVVTGSGQKSLLDKLDTDFHGLIDKDIIVTSFDVMHGKPSPEPYICGLKKAGINPNEGIVIENAPLGVRAAVAAKIFTIAVNTGSLPDSALLDEGANIVFSDMEAVSNIWNDLNKNYMI